MFVIFGWGHSREKCHGPTFKKICANCNNEDIWNLHELSVWFTLFFAPIFPYRKHYWLTCPVCSHGFELEAGDFYELKEVAELNSNLITGKINELEYHKEMTRLNEQKRLPDRSGT